MDDSRVQSTHFLFNSRSVSISSLTMKEALPRPRTSLDRLTSEDIRAPTRRKPSFRARAGSGRLSNSRSPGGNEAQNQSRYSRKISDIYKNPQLYTGVWQNNLCQWNFSRTCLYLVPTSIAFQFCAVFAAIFTAPGLSVHGMPRETIILPLTFSGVFGCSCISVFRALVKRFYNHRKKLICMVVGFSVYLSVGAVLVLMASVRALMTIPVMNNARMIALNNVVNVTDMPIDLDDDAVTNRTNVSRLVSLPARSHISSTGSQYLPLALGEVFANVSLAVKILAFIGFAIVGTSVGSGQYLIQSVMMTCTHSDRHQHVVIIATLASAAGGFLICILG